MNYSTLRALALSAFVLLLSIGTSAAEAGSVLLKRESTITAAGNDGSADFHLQDGAVDFDGFSDSVDTMDSGVAGPRVSANQNSRPTLAEDGGFAGAYAEGAASVASQPTDFAEAASAFDLTFEVMGAASTVNVGGAVGASGNGSTTVSLSNKTTGEIILAQEMIAGTADGQTVKHACLLDPGVYELLVTANVSGAPEDSMAYYTVSLSLGADAGGSPTPVPLPPALWSAAATLAAAAAPRGWRRLRSVATR